MGGCNNAGCKRTLTVIMFISYFGFAILLNSVGPVMLQVQESFQIGAGTASFLEGFEDGALAFVSLMLAPYILLLTYKRTLVVALAAMAAACLLLPLISAFWSLVILFTFVGACFAATKMSVFGLLGVVSQEDNNNDNNNSRSNGHSTHDFDAADADSDSNVSGSSSSMINRSESPSSHHENHLSLMNFLEAFFMLGVVCNYFLFSAFVNWQTPSSLSWMRFYFVVGGYMCLPFAILFFIPINNASPNGQSIADATCFSLVSELKKMGRLLIQPFVLVYVGCIFLYILIEQSVMSWMPSYNALVLKTSVPVAIQMSALLPATMSIGRLLSGVLLQYVRWYVIIGVCVISVLCLFVAVVTAAAFSSFTPSTSWGSAPWPAYVLPLSGLFLAPMCPIFNSLVLSAVPASEQGLISGLIVIFSALGGAAGSVITGFVFQTVGGAYSFYVVLIPLVGLFGGVFLFNRFLKPLQKEERTNSTESEEMQSMNDMRVN